MTTVLSPRTHHLGFILFIKCLALSVANRILQRWPQQYLPSHTLFYNMTLILFPLKDELYVPFPWILVGCDCSNWGCEGSNTVWLSRPGHEKQCSFQPAREDTCTQPWAVTLAAWLIWGCHTMRKPRTHRQPRYDALVSTLCVWVIPAQVNNKPSEDPTIMSPLTF